MTDLLLKKYVSRNVKNANGIIFFSYLLFISNQSRLPLVNLPKTCIDFSASSDITYGAYLLFSSQVFHGGRSFGQRHYFDATL